MIEKRLVQWYAADASVNLDIAEREIALTYVLRIMADHSLLDRLALKAGPPFARFTWATRDASASTWISLPCRTPIRKP